VIDVDILTAKIQLTYPSKQSIMKKLIILLLMIVSFYGCEKKYIVGSPDIIGKWSWINYCGGISYHCYTPESTNLKINIVFTADSIYNYYQNDTLTESTRFHTYKLDSFEPSDNQPYSTYIIKWDSGMQGIFSLTDGILAIWDGDYDGMTSHYKKIK
jgi:hypothetical protein